MVDAQDVGERMSEGSSSTVFEQISQEVRAILDDNGHLVDVSPALTQMFSVDRADLLSRPLAYLFGTELAERVISSAGPAPLALRGQRIRAQRDEERWVDLWIQRVGDQIALVIQDATRSRELEALLVSGDRLAAVGTVAVGVAHEINNPLAYILANLSYSVRELETMVRGPTQLHSARGAVLEEVVAALKDAEEGAQRVRQIARDLGSFSRTAPDSTEPLDVVPVLDSAINMAWSEIRHRANLVRDLGSLPLVSGNAGRLGQVFLNVLINAAQAIPEGSSDRHSVRVRCRTDSHGHANIEISDTGVGISPNVRAKIFDPFFTTKPRGIGTGLGLPISKKLLDAMGGTIEVESEPGVGTKVRISLPPAPGSHLLRAS
ncbi:MAG: ATP-binding protein [Myxococcota bacterium]